MKNVKSYYQVLIILSMILVSWWFASSTARVEMLYSRGVFRHISSFMRTLFGWTSISFGDFLYLLVICLLAYSLVRFVKGLKRSSNKIHFILSKSGKTVLILCWIWLIFHLLWGFNYYRENIGYQFNIAEKKFEVPELNQLSKYFLSETNRYGQGRKDGTYSIESSIKILQLAYDSLAVRHPHLRYISPSFKTSSFGVLGNYMGYGGYYNPLTGEAQVNGLQPAFFLPFTGAHEIAHQLGYAKESEANFIGYLASMYSGDSSLRYAANLEMFLYANRALYRQDSVAAKLNLDCLSPIAKRDLKTYRAYIEKYQGPIDKITSTFYTQFLKINNQPEGMGSYSRVIVWLFNYLKSEKAF